MEVGGVVGAVRCQQDRDVNIEVAADLGTEDRHKGLLCLRDPGHQGQGGGCGFRLQRVTPVPLVLFLGRAVWGSCGWY